MIWEKFTRLFCFVSFKFVLTFQRSLLFHGMRGSVDTSVAVRVTASTSSPFGLNVTAAERERERDASVFSS